jgi:hypothetical protein
MNEIKPLPIDSARGYNGFPTQTAPPNRLTKPLLEIPL